MIGHVRKDGSPAAFHRRRAIVLLFAIIGLGLILGALRADQVWFDRHFLPVFFLTRRSQVLGQTGARIVIGALGLVIALAVGPMIARRVAASPRKTLAAGAARSAVALL